MKKKNILALVAGCCLTIIQAQSLLAQTTKTAFVHPGLMQNRADLDYMKQKVLANQQPWAGAFSKLKQETQSYGLPKAYTHLSQGPYGADDIGGKQLGEDAKAAYNYALMWYITNDHTYADKSIAVLSIWSTTLWDLDDNNAKLLAGLTGHYLLNAAEILKYSNAGWKEADIHQFKKLMMTVYYPLIKDFFPEANGNWDASMINTMLCIGIFCDDRQIFDRAVHRFYFGTGNGGITKYIYPGGQVQETSRDWGHVQLGIGEFAKAAQTAWTQGVDLYSVAGNRLALGFEYTAKYMLGNDVPVYGNIAVKDRQNFRDIYESIYDHYHNISGLEMPYTLKAALQTRPKTAAALLSALKYPASAPKKQVKMPEGTVLRNAGALAGATVTPPANAINVSVNESVQSALDACAEKNGWVVLSKGVHKIDQPLRVPGGVTLSGMGKESILFLDAKITGKVVINQSNNMHNVTLRDFLIEGATSVTEGEDPNNNRRTRANQNAASREGIVFSCDVQGQMHDIAMIHMTVQNFTKNGVAIKGAQNIIIDSCNFSDNGSSVVPGPGIHHNLNLTHNTFCTVSNSRFDSSPWGCGIFILLSDNVKILNNEAARNKIAGISGAEVDKLQVRANLVEGNDGDGISLESVMQTGHDIRVTKNLCQNNGLQGINILQAGRLVSKDNISKANGKP